MLLKQGLSDGAYYLAGYAVECALKAAIAKKTRRSEFPDKKRTDLSYTHSLPQLLKVAGLEGDLAKQIASDLFFSDNWK